MTAAEFPPLLSSADAAEILGCKVKDLDHWRRTVLPGDPRKAAAQSDDEYRPDEVIAIAIGLWLKRTRPEEAERTAARFVSDPPEGEYWCVLKSTRKLEILAGEARAGIDHPIGVRSAIFYPDSYYDALRQHGSGSAP